MARSKPKTQTAPVVPPLPEIVRLAQSIANTERAIGQVVARNVQLQVKLNEAMQQESALRKTLTGLQRAMDRHTAGTSVH